MARRRLFTVSFINLFVFDVLYQLVAYMTNSIISVYALSLGASYAVAGVLAGLNPGSSFASRPFIGAVADLFSKKTLLVASTALFFLATLGCSAFESSLMLGLCRVVQGVSFALRSACVASITTVIVPAEQLGKGMGWMGMSSVASSAFGPMVAERIGILFGYQNSFVAASALLLVALLLAVALKRPPKPDAGRKKTWAEIGKSIHLKGFIYKPALPYCLIGGLSAAPIGVAMPLIIVAAEDRGVADPTLFFAFYACVALLGRPIFGRASDSVDLKKIALPLLAADLAAAVILMFMFNTAMVCLAGALLGLGQGALFSVLQAQSVRGVDPASVGKAANTYYIGPDLNLCISPIIGSALLGAFGVTAMFGYAAIAVLLGIVLACMYDI